MSNCKSPAKSNKRNINGKPFGTGPGVFGIQECAVYALAYDGRSMHRFSIPCPNESVATLVMEHLRHAIEHGKSDRAIALRVCHSVENMELFLEEQIDVLNLKYNIN